MKYPKVGEQVRIKNEAGLHTVMQTRPFGRTITGVRFAPTLTLSNGLQLSADRVITRHQKTIKTWIVQGWYGNGWEDVTAEETRVEGRARLRDYGSNSKYPHRLIVRYEPNDLYQGGES